MPATAVAPSTSGSPAATTAPNATSRMISIRAKEMSSDFLPSFASCAAISLAAETSPNCSTRTPGWAVWTAATAASGWSTSFSTCSSVPASLKLTTTERPSGVWTRAAGSSGLSISVTPSIRSRRLTTSLTAAVT